MNSRQNQAVRHFLSLSCGVGCGGEGGGLNFLFELSKIVGGRLQEVVSRKVARAGSTVVTLFLTNGKNPRARNPEQRLEVNIKYYSLAGVVYTSTKD